MNFVRAIYFALGLAVLTHGSAGRAQPVSGATVRMVVPFPAGGSADATARVVAQALVDEMKQNIIIDNRPGADATIGAEAVIRSAPDGSTLLMTSNTPIVSAPALRIKPPYDPLRAFTTIAIVGRADFFMFVHPSVPVNSLPELIAYVKANPDKLHYASGGATGILTMAQFVKAAGLRMTHVPYKGEAQALPDLLSGRVQILMGSTAQIHSYVKDGKLKILATLGAKRSPMAPQVPTFEEAGVRGMTLIPWYGLFGPAGLPSGTRQRLYAALDAALQKPTLVRQLEQQGVSIDLMGDARAVEFVTQQLDIWKKLVPESGIERE